MGGDRTGAAILASLLVLVPTLGSAEQLEPYVVCAHVPITGAAPIPHHLHRFGGFYFDAVNAEQGGIDGHPVEFYAYNDNYDPAGARDAADKCLDHGVDLLVGFTGLDQMASVARWAEDRSVPYLGQTAAGNVLDLDWSAMLGPEDEMMMRGLAATFTTVPSPRIATIYINSPFYDPGRIAFREAVEELGGEVIIEIPVQKDESNFQNIYIQLQRERITHINLYASHTIAIRMLYQKPSTYNPTWGTIDMLTGSNVVAWAADAQRAPFIALHDLSPVYDPYDETLPWRDEIEEFHRVYDAYSPEQDPPPDDADWMAYLRAKQIHRFLDARDGDVAPEALRAAFSSYAESEEEAYPSCSLDFAETPRVGTRDWHIFGTDRSSWQQLEFCGFATSLSGEDPIDPFAPVIDCGTRSQVATESVPCRIADPSGLASFEVADTGIPLGGSQMQGSFIGCPTEHTFELDLTPGHHEVTVTATDCDGFSNTRHYEIISLHV